MDRSQGKQASKDTQNGSVQDDTVGYASAAYPDRIRAAAPILRRTLMKYGVSNTVSRHRERSTEANPKGNSGICLTENASMHVFNGECDLALKQHKPIPPTHGSQSVVLTQSNALSKERNQAVPINCDTSSESRHKGVQKTDAPVLLHTRLDKKHYRSKACWQGNCHVTGELTHTCDGLEAYFPHEIFVGVYEASKQMPETLKLEAVPLSQLWPKKFKTKTPDGLDIGLCFTTSDQRSHRSFNHLLQKISTNIGLWTKIGDAELSIFSSKLLTPEYQRNGDGLYFWGTFGKRLRKKHCQPSNRIENMNISNTSPSNEDIHDKSENGVKLDVREEKETENAKPENTTLDIETEEKRGMGISAINNIVDMGGSNGMLRDRTEETGPMLDSTGGNRHDRVTERMTVHKTTDSRPASSRAVLEGCRTLESSNSLQSLASRLLAAPGLGLDMPPGFFSDVPPGFPKNARCQLPDGATAGSNVDASASRILGGRPGFPTNIRPGSTEAHRQPPTVTNAGAGSGVPTLFAGKKPVTNFDLNVPYSVGMDVSPGFTGCREQSIAGRSPACQRSGSPHRGASCRGTPLASGGTAEGSQNTDCRGSHSGFTTMLSRKNDARLPAVDKAKEKQMVSSSTAGESSTRTAAKIGASKNRHVEVIAGQGESSEEREIPRSRLISELLGLSPERQQVYPRKRGPQSSLEPTSADATKRHSSAPAGSSKNPNQGQGNRKARCRCPSFLPTSAPGSKIIWCMICGGEFPTKQR